MKFKNAKEMKIIAQKAYDPKQKVISFIVNSKIMDSIMDAAQNGAFHCTFYYGEENMKELQDFFENLGYGFRYTQSRNSLHEVSMVIVSWV